MHEFLYRVGEASGPLEIVGNCYLSLCIFYRIYRGKLYFALVIYKLDCCKSFIKFDHYHVLHL